MVERVWRYRASVTTATTATQRLRQPRGLIITLYGLYAREIGGWFSVAVLVRLLAELGVDEPAVRSSVSRLKRRGILNADRVGSVAGYALSERARGILDEGDRRIFERRRATLDEGWLLAVFSVPESEREKRHLLRSRLSWLGFGSVSAGVWVAPAHVGDEARAVLAGAGLARYVDLFEGRYLPSSEVTARVGDWWDLDRLQGLYGEFLVTYGPMRARYRRRRTVGEADAYRDYVTVLTDWRRLPYSDPGLAVEVLPARWKGTRATDTFFELQERLAGPAHRFVDRVRGAAPGST